MNQRKRFIPANESVDFRRGDRFLPLKKGGEEGFLNGSFGKIPLNPPFPKGEDSGPARQASLSTLSNAGIQRRVGLDPRLRGDDGGEPSDRSRVRVRGQRQSALGIRCPS